MQTMVSELVQKHAALWWEHEPARPSYGNRYTANEQREREDRLSAFQATVSAEARRAPRTGSEREATKARLLKAFRALASGTLGDEQGQLGVLLEEGLPEVGTLFAQCAHRYDPDMPASDIFQAMRNVWTMSCLQLLLGLPIRLTPAIFAYSMLYPYTDNYLDDASVPEADKVSFNERFARRLAGERVIPANLLESRVYDMVGMIEGQFDRASHAGVYGSLHAIHQAQCRSVSLMRLDASPYELDVLGISLHKGGASVLADGYLVAGDLDPAQAAFLFGWGAVVQFGDDLQDVVLDGQHGPITVFSQTAGRWPLDGVTDRTFHFGRKVMAGLDCFDGPNAGPVKDLMRRSASRLLIEAAGMADHLYTPDYVRELEPHSTLSFGFLRQRAKMMAGQTDSIMRLVEAFARLDPDEDPPPFPLPA